MRKKPSSSRRAGHSAHVYAVDERLVMPGSGFEIVDGEVFHVPGADPPHATRHSKLCALLEIYVAPEFVAASDMLTRTSATSDFAPDASIYPSAKDPETGGRQPEHLAFEIVSKQRLSRATKKAKQLVARGVRRVFALDLKRERALEWSRTTKSWEILSGEAIIDDVSLALPLPIGELVSAARADDAVARALLAKNNAVILEALEASQREGERRAKAEGILTVLRSRDLRVDPASADQIRSADIAHIDRWLTQAALCTSVRRLLASSVSEAVSTARKSRHRRRR